MASFSAKQVATRIGTDAKTLRKFLRSPESPYEPCGQGKRYEFDEAELKKIKRFFDDWSSGKSKVKPSEVKQVARIEARPKTEATRPDHPQIKHAVVLGDKGKCLTCGRGADDALHIKRRGKMAKPEVNAAQVALDDDGLDDWTDFEPTNDDLDAIEDEEFDDANE